MTYIQYIPQSSTEYTNVSVYNTTIYFIYIKIVHCQGDMFRPSLGHLQALKEKQIQDYIDFFCCKNALWDPQSSQDVRFYKKCM